MSEAWQSYPGAPASGTRLCGLEDLPERGTHSVDLDGFSVLLVRKDQTISAFVNACPHQYLPLDYRAADVLSAAGDKLICSNHDAVFDAETGAGLGGYAQGCTLDPIPVVLRGDVVEIGSR